MPDGLTKPNRRDNSALADAQARESGRHGDRPRRRRVGTFTAAPPGILVARPGNLPGSVMGMGQRPGVRRDAQEWWPVQGSTVSTPVCRNSAGSRVTMVSPRTAAAAARKASGTWSSSNAPSGTSDASNPRGPVFRHPLARRNPGQACDGAAWRPPPQCPGIAASEGPPGLRQQEGRRRRQRGHARWAPAAIDTGRRASGLREGAVAQGQAARRERHAESEPGRDRRQPAFAVVNDHGRLRIGEHRAAARGSVRACA